MAEDADGQMKLDFGRTADRIYINAKTSVTLMGNAGGGGGKTGLYLLPVYTIAGNVIGRNEKNGGHQLGVNQDIAPTLTGADRHAGNMETLMDAEVKRFRPTPEIRHKEWQKRGLMAPLQPQETPEYSFSDLQMSLYNTIYL